MNKNGNFIQISPLAQNMLNNIWKILLDPIINKLSVHCNANHLITLRGTLRAPKIMADSEI